MSMSMSNRDKITLTVLLVFVICALFVYFIYNPTRDHVKAQQVRYEELQAELTRINNIEKLLADAREKLEKVLENIDKLISSYYPYVAPQYYVDLFRGFSDEHELTVTVIDVKTPTTQRLDGTSTQKRKEADSLREAAADVNALTAEGSEEEEGEEEEEEESNTPQGRPGSVGIHELMLEFIGGNLEQYLGFLESINNIGYPIYVSACELTVTDDALDMSINVRPIFIDRFTPEQYREVEGKFIFEVLPQAESEDNFSYRH